MPTRALASSAAALLLAAASSPASAQLFTPLGPIPSGESSNARALSSDGNTLVGDGVITVAGVGSTHPFRWTRTGGMSAFSAGQPGFAAGVSADGQVIAGSSGNSPGPRPAFRWTPAGAIQIIGTLPGGTYAYLNGCSADGSMITGVGYTPDAPNGRALLWTGAAGMVPLPMPAGNTFSDAPGITPDGAVFVGSTGTYAVVPPTSRAVRWIDGSIEDLGVLPGVSHSGAAAVSADGSIVVGSSGVFYDPTGVSTIRAFRWTAASGMLDLHLPRIASRALGINADGSLVVGTATFRTGPSAFIWTQDLGLLNLNYYLPMLGADLGTRSLQTTVGVSADGRTIAGTARRSDTSRNEAWIADLPSPLPPCLTLGPVELTPACPRENISLSIAASVSTPYAYVWQVRTSAGEWIDIAGTVTVGCAAGVGGTISESAPPDPASPTLNLLLRPCGGLSSYTFRALVYTDCTSKISDEAVYTICRPDYDCDSTVSVLDIFAYLSDWFRGVPATNFDNSDPATLSNLMAFLSDWLTGC